MDLGLHLREWSSRHCFGHTLQLAIDDGIKMSPDMQEMIKSPKAIVAFTIIQPKPLKELQNGTAHIITCFSIFWSKGLQLLPCVLLLQDHG